MMGGMGDMMSGMMRGMGKMMGGMGMGGSSLWIWLLVLALVIVLALILFRLWRRRAEPRFALETPLVALQRRLAIGEISVDEFAAMKQHLTTN